MASSSKTFLLLGFMFALVILISSEVSARELVQNPYDPSNLSQSSIAAVIRILNAYLNRKGMAPQPPAPGQYTHGQPPAPREYTHGQPPALGEYRHGQPPAPGVTVETETGNIYARYLDKKSWNSSQPNGPT
ncbi:hypothetical protein ACE6H2_015042 [Prunus campanulata]